jgi:hypothetical protein
MSAPAVGAGIAKRMFEEERKQLSMEVAAAQENLTMDDAEVHLPNIYLT